MTYYNHITINHEQIFITCDSLELAEVFLRVRNLIDKGHNQDALELLNPLVANRYGEALYLRSLALEHKESKEDADKWHLKYLIESASMEYPPAVYRYGVYNDTGEYFKQDKDKAAFLFKKSAELGHARSEWIHGTALLYGASIFPENHELGMAFVKKSSDKLFVEALETMSKIYENGEFGFSQDRNKSEYYRFLKNKDDAIFE